MKLNSLDVYKRQLLAHAILNPVQVGHQERGLDIQHKGQLLHALDQRRRGHLRCV